MQNRIAARNSSLDSLRGLSTIMIVVYHIFSVSGFSVSHADSIGAYTDRLNVGVSIFFVLSGFLIFRPFVHALLNQSPTPKTSTYYFKRAARILPGYWCALFVLAAADALTIRNSSGFLRNVFLVHSFTMEGVFTGIRQAWTLTVEMSFYLVTPIFIYFLSFRSRKRDSTVSIKVITISIACIFFSSYLFRLFLHATHFWFLQTAHIWFPAHIDTIALGMFVALLVEAPEKFGPFFKFKIFLARHSGLVLTGSLVVWILSANINMSIGWTTPAFHIDLLCHFLYGISSLLLLIPFCVDKSSRFTRVLSIRVLSWLGTISYGIYLWHMAFLGGNFAEKFMPYTENDGQVLLRIFWVIPLSIALAVISFYCLERPIMRTVNKRFPASVRTA